MGILSDAPEMQGQLVSAHGMLAILEVLEGRGSREVIMRLLQIINLVSTFHVPDGFVYVLRADALGPDSSSQMTRASWRVSA